MLTVIAEQAGVRGWAFAIPLDSQLLDYFAYRNSIIGYHFFSGKMADEEQQEIEDALNTIASSTERSTNMKKELKQTIYENVNTIRKLNIRMKIQV